MSGVMDKVEIDYGYVRQSGIYMKAVVVESYGGPIQWKDIERPTLPDEKSSLIGTM